MLAFQVKFVDIFHFQCILNNYLEYECVVINVFCSFFQAKLSEDQIIGKNFEDGLIFRSSSVLGAPNISNICTRPGQFATEITGMIDLLLTFSFPQNTVFLEFKKS